MRSNAEWIQWGRRDPLFGVASWPGRERGGPQEWTDEEFYELGRSDWADFLARWTAYGVDTSSCVEIGAGAGRLTMHLAATFGQVQAVDVSAEMLAYARHNIAAANVAYLVTDGAQLPLADGSVTAAFSTHVFQHFDAPRDGAAVFAELARVLAPKGSLMVHLPVHAFPFDRTRVAVGMRLLYAAGKNAGNLRAAYKRWAGRGGRGAPIMRGLSYELGWLLDLLGGLGFTDVELAVFAVASNGVMHPFVLGRKP